MKISKINGITLFSHGTFTFNSDLWLKMDVIPEEHKLRFYKYVCDYAFYEHDPNPMLRGFEYLSWGVIRNSIDKANGWGYTKDGKRTYKNKADQKVADRYNAKREKLYKKLTGGK
jgi:hypothetical protein